MHLDFEGSTSLISADYDATTKTLLVKFVRGGVYEYYAVPQHEVDALARAQSAGQHFARNIRNKYKFKEL